MSDRLSYGAVWCCSCGQALALGRQVVAPDTSRQGAPHGKEGQAVKAVLNIADDFPPVTVQHFDGAVCVDMPEAQCFLDASQARILAAILVAYAAELETS